MIKYILKRILWMLPVIFGVLCIVFFLSVITPGDPIDTIVGQDAPPEVRDAMREAMGLNDPVLVRFGRYVFGIVTKGDLGNSYKTGEPIVKELVHRFPTTIKLAFFSVLVAIIVAIPLGLISAIKRYSWIDNASMAVALFGVSVPQFWFGLMAILVFAVKIKIFPASGVDDWKGWILPVAMIGIGNAGNFARITRSSMLEVIRQDYVRTARAKGQNEMVITFRHCLRNALIPIVANIGNMIGISLGGAVIAESIFSIPGVGKYMLDAITARDWPAVMGGIVILALSFSIVMLVMDILYTTIDPRLKAEFKAKLKINARKRKVQEA